MPDRRSVLSYVEAFRQLGIDVGDRMQMREWEDHLRWVRDAHARYSKQEAEREIERRDRKSRLLGWGLSILSTVAGGGITWILAHGQIAFLLTK